MAINFPDSPSDNDIYTVNGKRWIYSSGKWSIYGTTAPDATASDTEPTGVGDGHIWYRSDQSQTLIRYDNTWVEVGSAGGFDSASTNFPTSLDSATGFAAVEALQAKVGADSSAVTSSLDYKVADHASRITTLEGASGGKILQVVNATHSTQVLVSSTTYGATGLTASITPSATSSKVFVIISNPMYAWNENQLTTDSGGALSKLYRDGSEVFDFYQFGYNDNASVQRFMRMNATLTYMDSPATTSSVSYEQYIASYGTSYSVYSCKDNMTASITLMEVAG
jgi:hypothetical protein